MTPDYFRTMAGYNRWANRLVYEAVATLSDADYRLHRKAFFGSIHGTLNHLLVGDWIWLNRLAGEPDPVKSLDEILYDDFASLRSAREAEDARLIETVDPFDEAGLAADLVYRLFDGSAGRTPHHYVFAHLFNHQTHHRGQVHNMLSQTGFKPPQLDLIYFLREAA